MADDMKPRNCSPPTTSDAYTYHVGRFAEFLGKSPNDAVPEDVRSFQLHLIEVRKVGWGSCRQAVCGLRRHRPPRTGAAAPTHAPSGNSSRLRAVSMVPFGKKPKTLPAVISADEVTKLLSCVKNFKHQKFLLTLYAAGLRLHEGRTADCRCELPLDAE